MTQLAVVYASAPADEVILSTLEIAVPGLDPVRVVADFVDHELGVDGVMRRFEAASLTVTLPQQGTTGQQNLTFSVSNASGRAQGLVDAALTAGGQVQLIYREYLSSDKTQPARRPYTMVMTGGELQGVEAVFEASYYDLLNTAWPRERYTVETAPGLKYL